MFEMLIFVVVALAGIALAAWVIRRFVPPLNVDPDDDSNGPSERDWHDAIR